jgi:hypothetical protein
MEKIKLIIILLVLSASVAFSQLRDYRVHSRGMLHQTVFNTGEVGRAYDAGGTGIAGGYPPSMEWPPNGHEFIDRKEYEGQHNSMGGGVYIGGSKNGLRLYDFCGAVSDNNGNTTPVEGVFSTPLSLERTENYPVLANGNLNPSYNPDEAEEIIVSTWRTINTGITIKRTSRAWSFPGYNTFIIYEYEFQNTSSDTLADAFIAWTYAFSPSMFGYERKFNRWAEGDYRNQEFSRFDLRRWMSYNHERDGRPDTVLFNTWSQPGNRGGLNSPQAAGLMVLHYDYNHLADSGKTNLYVPADEGKVIWDADHKVRQPYLLRNENGNLYYTKIQAWLDNQARKTGPFKGKADSTNFPDNNYYWLGRVKPSYKLSFSQPVNRGYGFGPYTLAPGDVAKFTVAEVVGYGPGIASDTIYKDLGGSTLVSTETGSGLHPVPSWYNSISYPEVQNPNSMGSNYLQTHPLPWFVDPKVVSIRDAADRVIEMYTGGPLVKWDSLQFEPKNTPVNGNYKVKIPFPAPVIRVDNTSSATNKVIWGPQVEAFATPRLTAGFSHYLLMRALNPLGPWTLIDSVGRRDPRYFKDSIYVVSDILSDLGVDVYYAVYSVDLTGGKSGFTNMTYHVTQAPAAPVLGKVYVVPNPLVVTNGRSGSAAGGDVSDQIGFFGLTKKCTIKIFSFSGQLVQTLEHDGDAYSEVSWFQISRNHQMVASGVYFFVVQDAETGKLAKGKFVIIH